MEMLEKLNVDVRKANDDISALRILSQIVHDEAQGIVKCCPRNMNSTA